MEIKRIVSLILGTCLFVLALVGCSAGPSTSVSSNVQQSTEYSTTTGGAETRTTNNSGDALPTNNNTTSGSYSNTAENYTTGTQSSRTSFQITTTGTQPSGTSRQTYTTGRKLTTTHRTTGTTGDGNSSELPTVLYQKIIYDKLFYKNTASIEKMDINNGKMFITFKVLEHNGDGFDTFATDAIFYDANNNIIEINQVMYVNNIGVQIGTTHTDYTYIPKGTKTILINSATKDVNYKVSKNHGNSTIELDIPSVCYDKAGNGSAVEVKSYNIYEGKIFFTYMVRECGKYESSVYATDMICYNAKGNVIDTKQVLYANEVSKEAIGNVYFDYTYIPDGTAKIEIRANKVNSVTTTKTTTKTTNTTAKPTLAEWTPLEIAILKKNVESLVDLSIDISAYAMSFEVGVETGGSFGIGFADSNAKLCTGGVSKVISLLATLEPYITKNVDLSYAYTDVTVYLKEEFSSVKSIASKMQQTSISGSSSLSTAQEYSKMATALMSDCMNLSAIMRPFN